MRGRIRALITRRRLILRGKQLAAARRALVYRPKRILELDALHPGLQSFIEAEIAKRTPFRLIAAEVSRRWGVSIPPQTLSMYWRLYFWRRKS